MFLINLLKLVTNYLKTSGNETEDEKIVIEVKNFAHSTDRRIL